jgi:hypothetical protein
MFFELTGQDFEYYNPDNSDGIIQVDINLLSPSPLIDVIPPRYKVSIDLEIWDNYENQYSAVVNGIQCDYVISNIVDHSFNDPRILFNDFVFNLTKAAYAQQSAFSRSKRLFFVLDKKAYHLPNHFDPAHKKKIYVAPNKTHVANSHIGRWNHKVRLYRTQLVDLLLKDYQYLGYTGDVFRHPSLFLYSHLDLLDDFNDLTALENHDIPIRLNLNSTSFLRGYSPPHTLYYENTFISIYGETIEHGTTIVVTEKTYDPLIKGHFILPFSCQGFISHLRRLGFLFPDFIDYNYDNQYDDGKRFGMYNQEIKRLLSLDIDIWRQQWTNNLDKIQHNQSIFFDRDYDKIDFDQIVD